MAKKVLRETTKARKVTAATKGVMTARTGKRGGRTPDRTAKGVDKVKATARKSATGTRGKKKAQVDPEVEATRARNRALWKSQEQEATAIELSKRGALVDERARVRTNIGMSWSNRKPR